MADKRFFTLAGPFTAGELAELTGSELFGPEGSATVVLRDVAALQDAGADHLSFLDNRKYLAAFHETKAAACFIRPEMEGDAPKGLICLKSSNPYKAYALAAAAFYPPAPLQNFRASGALVDPSATIGKNCFIDYGVVIGAQVKIGDNCRIHSGAVINAGVVIGAGCEIGANVCLSHALIGNKVRIHPGAVIGRPGFGFAIAKDGYTDVPQLGRVVIEDDVAIGANTTVDRGAGPDTVIGQGSRIDNLVQIGHNVKIGKYCIIVSQTGISGSTEVGDYVMIGGQAGFAGHIKIGAGAKIAGQAGVLQDVPAGAEVMGTPAIPLKTYLRQTVMLSKMAGSKEKRQK